MRGLDIDRPRPLGGYISVKLGPVMVPLEGVETSCPEVKGATEGSLLSGEGVLRHIHAPE